MAGTSPAVTVSLVNMMTRRDVAVIVGSLRRASLNRRMAHVLAALAPGRLGLEIVEIGELALYNEDLEANPPESWLGFRERIRRTEAILFVTPEYNRSIPGGLKNAIDVGSRPYGRSAWNGKPAAVISVSPGSLGGFGAHQQVRQALASLNMPLLPHPEAYVGRAGTLFGAPGELIHDGTREFLTGFLTAFAAWIDTTVGTRDDPPLPTPIAAGRDSSRVPTPSPL